MDRTKSRQEWIPTIRGMAPAFAEELSTNRDSVFRLVEHPIPNVRAASVMAGHAIWQLDGNERFVDCCCRMILSDKDELPRDAAVAVLSLEFENSKNKRIQKCLATVVADESNSTFSRNCAYRGILDIEQGASIQDMLIGGVIHNEVINLLAGKGVRLVDIYWNRITELLRVEE